MRNSSVLLKQKSTTKKKNERRKHTKRRSFPHHILRNERTELIDYFENLVKPEKF